MTSSGTCTYSCNCILRPSVIPVHSDLQFYLYFMTCRCTCTPPPAAVPVLRNLQLYLYSMKCSCTCTPWRPAAPVLNYFHPCLYSHDLQQYLFSMTSCHFCIPWPPSVLFLYDHQLYLYSMISSFTFTPWHPAVPVFHDLHLVQCEEGTPGPSPRGRPPGEVEVTGDVQEVQLGQCQGRGESQVGGHLLQHLQGSVSFSLPVTCLTFLSSLSPVSNIRQENVQVHPPSVMLICMLWIRLEDTSRYAGLLLAPAEGFGLWPRAFLANFLAIFGVQ